LLHAFVLPFEENVNKIFCNKARHLKFAMKCKVDVCACFYLLVFLLTTRKISRLIPQKIMRPFQNHIRHDCFADESSKKHCAYAVIFAMTIQTFANSIADK
jgi:hypothetical protein